MDTLSSLKRTLKEPVTSSAKQPLSDAQYGSGFDALLNGAGWTPDQDPKLSKNPRLIILVTGDICAGKDYCAQIWLKVFTSNRLTARAVSISDATKREYAIATGANFEKLVFEREYKEQHRPQLTEFFHRQVKNRPSLPEEHFLQTVNENPNLDVLLITGMRDESPVPAFSHLVPHSRVIEVRVNASKEVLRARKGAVQDDVVDVVVPKPTAEKSTTTSLSLPNLIFNNSTLGPASASSFATHHLLPFLSPSLHRLSTMIPSIPDFPRPGATFQHILDIAQKLCGLTLCISLLRENFLSGIVSEWENVNAIVGSGRGGLIFGSALSAQLNLPFVVICEEKKLPPPVVSVGKAKASYISSLGTTGERQGQGRRERFEVNWDRIPREGEVVIVDDVLSSGETLCAMVELLVKAGVRVEDISVLIVAEFPVHRGRELLRQRGFGEVKVLSLLVFGCD